MSQYRQQQRPVGSYTGPPTERTVSSNERGAQKTKGSSRLPRQETTKPSASTRLPQTTSQRRPSLPGQASSRPPLTHQNQSWNSIASNSSSYSTARVATTSSSSSGKPTDTRLKQPRNVLRRKSTSLFQGQVSIDNMRGSPERGSGSLAEVRSHGTSGSSASQTSDRRITASPAEIEVAQAVEIPTTTAHTITIYPELDRYRDTRPWPAKDSLGIDLPYKLATQNLPPPTPLFSGTSSQLSGFSGSPSTRFSESPGPGPYSRDTTPTSISSQSPCLVAPMRTPGSRMKLGSPAQIRQRRGTNDHDEVTSANLSVIRELSTSSSSNSTVRAEAAVGTLKKKKKLSPPPPSPPPRKSSQKFNADRVEEVSLQSNHVRGRSQPFPISPPLKSPQFLGHKSPRATPPIRPSRDGTPDLQNQLGLALPVIHSNLSSSSFSENRRMSANLAASSASRTVQSSSSVDRAQPSRLPQTREPTPQPRSGSQQPDKSETGRTTRTPSPSVSTFRAGFRLFGRRTKTASDIDQVDKKDKKPRKGPAAGTGHEGYGRIGASHRRRSSTNGSLPRDLPGIGSSQESLTSLQSNDPFLTERMNPIVISRGEIVDNQNTSTELGRTESNQSLPLSRPSIESRNGSQVSLSSRDGRNTLWPSALPRGNSKTPSLGSRRPSDSSDSEGVAMKSTLAFRRSIQRLNQAPDQPQVRIPKPILVRSPQAVPPPAISSIDTGILSDESSFEPPQDPVRGRKDAKSVTPKKLTKKARSPRRWNIFGRSQSQPAVVQPNPTPATRVATSVKVVQMKQEPKPVAFYAMVDSSEQEDIDIPAVQEVLREAHVLHLPSNETADGSDQAFTDSGSTSRQPSNPATQDRKSDTEVARETRPDPRPANTRAVTAPQQMTSTGVAPSRNGRPSRLPQVGRIPKVVSARPEQTSPKSFSRPFNRVSLQLPPPGFDSIDKSFVAKGPSPPKSSTPELTRDGSTATIDTIDSGTQPGFSTELQTTSDFLRFSPRKNSESTTGTTTSSSSARLAYITTTAVIPDAHAPLVEDEIWDEYNDLLGEEALKLPPSAGSSQGVPFHLEGYGRRLDQDASQPLESPTYIPNPARSVAAMMAEKPLATSSVYEAEEVAKLNDALEQDKPILTPFSVGEFVSGYGDRNNSVGSGLNEERPKRDSVASDSTGKITHISTTSSCSQSSEDNSPVSQVNLRVGSMTVSKWLTFGHVLFSPARDELIPVIGSLKRHSILVIDGLGNDDWSFYAAETYPAATFFNLSPRAPLPTEHKTSATFPLSPPNHHQIQYTSHAQRFPFAPESFTSVVFRFPAAAPESQYRNIISEARRVLKPGGFLELSILDLDLNNMGPRTRRAVRKLKEQIHARAPETNMGSCADMIVRIMGTRGFSDIKSCRVGVPVASAIPRAAAREGGRKIKTAAKKEKKPKDVRSLAEMMSDESPVADESITNMVAKVGRWWHTQCYETPAGGAGPVAGGIWSDRALLGECEEWGTSLKLTVCHARVPDVKRTASV